MFRTVKNLTLSVNVLRKEKSHSRIAFILETNVFKTGPKGSFHLGPVDRYAAKKMMRIHERHIEELPESPSRISTETDSSSTDHDNLSSDLEFNVETIPSGPYSLVKTPRFAAELIRAGISLRAGSAIFNAILSDLKDCGKHGLCSTPSGVILKSMTKFYNK